MIKRRAAFLFGSGISRLSGAMTVDGITKSLLTGAWKPHTDWKFYPCQAEDGLISLADAKRAQDMLLIMKECIDPHLLARERRTSNYEDLFSAALQILQDETIEIPNPLIARSLDWIKGAATHLYVGHEAHIDDNSFASLVERATDLIQWVVYYGLVGSSKPIGFTAITETARATEQLDIFTLNHDLLVEAQLKQDTITFKDGFSNQHGDARIFSTSWREADTKIRLLKLHGSINWYLFRFKEWDQFAVVDGDPDLCRDPDGELLDPLDVKPMFLTGTAVKEQAYGTGLFGEIFSEFHRLLATHRTLICCGYGWGDKGINTRLRQWLRDAKDNRIVILHNGSVDELRRKRFWFWHWDNLLGAGKVVVVPKWLTDCKLSDLQPYFEE